MKSSFAVATLLMAPLAWAAPTATPPSYGNDQVSCQPRYSVTGDLLALGSGNFNKTLSTAGDSLLLKVNPIAQSFTFYDCAAKGYTAPSTRNYGLLKPSADGFTGTKCLGALNEDGDSRVRLQECPREAGSYLSKFWFERGDDNLQLIGKPGKDGLADTSVARRSLTFQGDIVSVTNKDYGKLPQFVLATE